MRQTAMFATVNRPPSQSAPAAAAFTIFSTGFWKSGMALCLLLLFGLTAAAQTTYPVTRLDDISATQLSPIYGVGLGWGVPGDLRYGIWNAIANGGEQIINFARDGFPCTTDSPCVITLNGPLPPI